MFWPWCKKQVILIPLLTTMRGVLGHFVCCAARPASSPTVWVSTSSSNKELSIAMIMMDRRRSSRQADAAAKAREGYRASERGHSWSRSGQCWKNRRTGSGAREVFCAQSHYHGKGGRGMRRGHRRRMGRCSRLTARARRQIFKQTGRHGGYSDSIRRRRKRRLRGAATPWLDSK